MYWYNGGTTARTPNGPRGHGTRAPGSWPGYSPGIGCGFVISGKNLRQEPEPAGFLVQGNAAIRGNTVELGIKESLSQRGIKADIHTG